MIFQRMNEAGKVRERQRRRRITTHPGVANRRRPGTYQCRWRTAYRMPMGDGYGEDWATYLRRMTSRPGWSVARLARESHIHRGTIFKWMKGERGVTVASVRAIARAVGDDVANALRAAGEVTVASTERDQALERILAAPVSDAEKQRMIERLYAIRERQRATELDEVQWWIQQRRDNTA